MNERRASSVILLAGAVLAAFILCGPAEPCQAQTTQASTQPATRPQTPQTGPSISAPEPKLGWYIPVRSDADKKTTIGSLDSRTGYMFQVEVVSGYAAIRTLKLSDYFTSVSDKQAFHNDPDAYMKRINAPGADDGHYTLLNHVQLGKARHLPLATSIYIRVDGEKWRKTPNISKAHWRMGKTTEDDKTQSVSFHCTAYRGRNAAEAGKNPCLELTKTYTIRKKDYTVKVSLNAKNLSSEKITLRVDQSGPTGVPLESHRTDERYAVWGQVGKENTIDVMVDKKTGLTEEHFATRSTVGTTAGASDSAPVLWLGQGNKFFASMFYLNPEVDRKAAANYNASVYHQAAYESSDSLTHITGLEIPAWSLAPKASKTMKFDLFAGPKRRAMFTDTGDELFNQQYEDLNYRDTITLGTCGMCTFAVLTFGMMWLLNIFASVAFGNYGLAIFILVILVRLVLHPLSKKGQISMAKTQKAMKKIQPMLAKLKEKYANDKETLQKETMKLYKEQGANPMAGMMGCLPMMLQMPIWIALYGGLNAAVELRHAGLLPFWITDLAAPDALFSFGTSLPLLGSTFNLLPILLTVAMFLQTKMNPATSNAAATPEQASQQKMMKYMMPGMMLMFFYSAPSGLSLYIMTSISGGVIEGIFIRKHIAEKEAAEAAATTTVRVGGKGFRDNREKKPKSPYKKPW
ncbi:MAG: YidC/Oxa1 family insertase periplasmic-domain containing protein [Phycisphaerae bacterium]|nr:YidC/Oxa1 family insertase periplasmic-domain containing protein [Phycisphaerae bacterium]